MNFKHPLILASNSPRRKSIMTDAGFTFTVAPTNMEEIIPDGMPLRSVPSHLAEQKIMHFSEPIGDAIVIAADTVVLHRNKLLGKPKGKVEAMNMLKRLSGSRHTVVTGVCLHSNTNRITFEDTTEIYFKKLSTPEIAYYVSQFKPYDKAGAYGIQEWIGMIGVERIEGSFYNVMGLPIHKLYENLVKMVEQDGQNL